jgi:hypothetical protein
MKIIYPNYDIRRFIIGVTEALPIVPIVITPSSSETPSHDEKPNYGVS